MAYFEGVVFHPESLGYTDAVGGGKFLGEMLIHGAVQFIQFLLADAGEYAECVAPEVFSQFYRSCHVFIFDVRGAKLSVADSPANNPEYQAEPEYIDFELAEETDYIVALLVIA